MKLNEIELPQGTKTRNIAELKDVSINAEFELKEFEKEDGSTFSYYVYEQDGENFRVPNSVIAQLKAQLENNKDLTVFTALKSGSGLDTTYTVVSK